MQEAGLAYCQRPPADTVSWGYYALCSGWRRKNTGDEKMVSNTLAEDSYWCMLARRVRHDALAAALNKIKINHVADDPRSLAV